MGAPLRVVVTGAAGGAGRAAVELFAEDGDAVAAIVHRTPLHESVRAASNVTEYTCDVASAAEVNETFDRISAELGGIDALVHTAAIENYVRAGDITPEQLTEMLNVNVGGTVYTNQAAYRHMKAAGGGSIINFHSLTGIRGFPMLGHYAASKAAVGGWTRAAAFDWGVDNVRVNAIAPIMLTPMAKTYREGLSEEELASFLKGIGQVIHVNGGEFGDPKRDIAPVVRFLAREDGRYLTGQTISVDGGWVKLGS